GPQAHRVHEHDVGREARGEGIVDHGVAAELDHDHPAPEALDVGKRLHEDGGALLGGTLDLGLAHEVPVFSSMYPWVRSLVRIRARPSPRPSEAVTSMCSRSM